MSDEKELLAGLKKGDPVSFERLYRKWSGRLYNFVFKLSKGDRYLSEEIVQSVFVQIWEKRDEVNPERSFSGYICTLAKHRLINHYKHVIVETLYFEKLSAYPIPDHSTEKEIEYNLLNEFMDELIDELPPARKKIFLLSRREYLPNKEIAQRLSISESTVESQLVKAIAYLRKRLSRFYCLFF